MKAVLPLLDLDDSCLATDRRPDTNAAANSVDGNAAAPAKRHGGEAPMVMQTPHSKKIQPKLLIAHRFALDQIIDAHNSFARAADSRDLKAMPLEQRSHA
jgi:hypothetical protein